MPAAPPQADYDDHAGHTGHADIASPQDSPASSPMMSVKKNHLADGRPDLAKALRLQSAQSGLTKGSVIKPKAICAFIFRVL